MNKHESLAECTATNIVLIKPSALGDIVQSLPVLSALRRRFPDARITWVVNRIYESLLGAHPDLTAVLPFDRKVKGDGLVSGAARFFAFLKTLKGMNFDLAVDLQGLLRSGLMTRATGARWRLGLESAREGAGLFYTHRVDDCTGSKHAVDRYWRVAEVLGMGAMAKHFHLPINADATRWGQAELAGYPRPWIAVSVGARWLTKRWPPQHFAELLRRAQRMAGGTAIFVGAGDEASIAETTGQLLAGPWRNFAGKTSLPQLAALLAGVDVMLSNDTGPLHLAVALGRPIVAPYTCTRVELNGPFGQDRRAVETTVPCKGSYLRTCDRLVCMAELVPDRLWPTLQEILVTWQRQPA